MVNMKTRNPRVALSFLLGSLVMFNAGCSEYFGRKPSKVDYELVELLLQYSTSGGNLGCRRFSLEPIRGGTSTNPTNGTRQGFEIARCISDSDLERLGFTTNQLEFTGNGVRGMGDASRIASQIDFVTLGGRKEQVVEVTFQLNSSSAQLDVITNASVGSNASLTGPGFRITTQTILGLSTNGSTPAIPGTNPATPVNAERTYCLESHDEGSAHIFGWARPCGVLTQNDRQNYEFDLLSMPSQIPGNRMGFVLRNATIYRFSVGERIGLSGAIRWHTSYP